MNANEEFLNYIHQNAEMGISSINRLLEIVDDSEFKEMLKKQFNQYNELYNKSKNKLNALNKDAKGINKLQKIETYLMINMKTISDKSANHIAEMLIQGSTMGIIQIIRRLKQYNGNVDDDIYNLGKTLLDIEQYNVDECKEYLR